MSADYVVTGDADNAHSGTQRGETCRAPNCWRDAEPVRVADETERVAVLCDKHRQAFLGVSS
jgi:hypothetical protein